MKTPKKLLLLALIMVGGLLTWAVVQAGTNVLTIESPTNGATISSFTSLKAVSTENDIGWVNLYKSANGQLTKVVECYKQFFTNYYCDIKPEEWISGTYDLKVISTIGDYQSPTINLKITNPEGLLTITTDYKAMVKGQATISGRQEGNSFSTVKLNFYNIYNFSKLEKIFNCTASASSWTCAVDTTQLNDGLHEIKLVGTSGNKTVTSKASLVEVKNAIQGCKGKTCAQLSKQCGEANDNCGKIINCGQCNGVQACNISGRCVAMPRSLTITSPIANSTISGQTIFKVSAAKLIVQDKVSLVRAGTNRFGMKYAQITVDACQSNSDYTEYSCEVDTGRIDRSTYYFYATVNALNLYSQPITNIKVDNSSVCQVKGSCFYNLKAGCGIHQDGCGGQINCGTCQAGYSCITGKCLDPQKKDKTIEIVAPQAGETINGQTVIRVKAYNLSIYDTIEIKAVDWGGTIQAVSNNTVSRCKNVDQSLSEYTCPVNTNKMVNAYYDLQAVLIIKGGWTVNSVVVPNIIVKNGTSCQPKTCSTNNYQCGYASDGCGKQINCGSCTNGTTCANNQCVKNEPTIDIIYPTEENIKASRTFTFKIRGTHLTSADKVRLYILETDGQGTETRRVIVDNCTKINKDFSDFACALDTIKAKLVDGKYKFVARVDNLNIESYPVRYLTINNIATPPQGTPQPAQNIIPPVNNTTSSPALLTSSLKITTPKDNAKIRGNASFLVELKNITGGLNLFVEKKY
ncbi:MAG: hypothetical protein V1765_02835 [bacterium]